MADVNISKYRASVVRSGSAPATPGFVVSEGQNPVEPAGSEQNHLPVTINATATGLAITTDQVLSGAGTVGQYIRGDGSLADFPASTGGGSSVSYYLNGSISQGTIGGVAYKELSKTPILGAGTQFTINADGYIASFLTDAGDPNLLEIPGGNWNFETYFSASSGGGSPTFYVELYKYDGSTFTLIASNSGSPELIAFGTNVNSYFSTLAVPTTALTLTDRLAIRYYVTHSGRTITLHTENNTLCQIITTFTTGLTALNGLTAQVQYFAVGTSGTDFNIASATQTHTFNLPTASASNRGALSSSDWTTFNNKQNALTNPVTGTGTTNYLPKFTGTSSIGNSIVQDAGIRVDIGGDIRLTPSSAVNIQAYTGSVYTNLFYNAASHNWQNSGGATKMFLNSNDNLLIGTTTDGGQRLQVTGTVALRASASGSSATQIPIFAADPSGTTRELVTRTPAQLLSDIGGQAALTNPVTGTGTTNYLAKFTGASTIGNSQIFDNGTNVGIGTASPDRKLGILVSPSATGDDGINITNGSTPFILTRTGASYTYRGVAANAGMIYSSSNIALLADGSNITFHNGNGQVASIQSNGNLLVGTTTDNGARLQVSGTSTFSGELNLQYNNAIQTIQGNTGFSLIRLYGGNGSSSNVVEFQIRNRVDGGDFSTVGNFSNHDLQIRTNNTTRLTIAASTGAATFSSSVTAASIASNNGGFRLKESSQTSSRNWIIGNDWLVYGDLGIGQSTTQTGSSYTYPLYINPNGNVGIGTSSPSNILHLFKSTYPILTIQSTSYQSSLGIDTASGLLVLNNESNAALGFNTNATERMRITSGGNVGIGTSSPDSQLTLNGSSNSRLNMRAGDTRYGTLYADNGVFAVASITAIPLVLGTNDIERMRITSGGNVLIGTTTDGGYKLDVNGTTRSSIAYKFGTYTQGTTTPSVSNVSIMIISNSSPTTITNFTNAVAGQVLTLGFSDSNTTINRANAYLLNGNNYTSGPNDFLQLVFDGTYWFEISRSSNA